MSKIITKNIMNNLGPVCTTSVPAASNNTHTQEGYPKILAVTEEIVQIPPVDVEVNSDLFWRLDDNTLRIPTAPSLKKTTTLQAALALQPL